MADTLPEFTEFVWWMYNRTPLSLIPSQPTWDASAYIGCCHLHPPLLLNPEDATLLYIPERVESWVVLDTAVRICSLCPRLYITAVV